ncbi:MAG: hypothetical protein RJA07_209 [Bacteroidota bacterium]|jgi:hypothetical protein
MPTSEQNIPTQIFDWMSESNFDSLQKNEQNVVLQFFTKEEFDELNFASTQIKSFTKKQTGSKQFLLSEFDKQHGQKEKQFFFTDSSMLWKAAVLLLLMGVGILQFSILNKNGTTDVVAQTIHDTIFSVKNIVTEPIKIHDTVLIAYQKPETENFENKGKIESVKIMENEKLNNLPKPDFNVLTISDLQSKPNRQRSGSVRYDTLLKQFQFVTL